MKALARAYDHGHGLDSAPELPFDWNADAATKLNRLALYASRRLYDAAATAYDAAWNWGTNIQHGRPNTAVFLSNQANFDDAEYDLLRLLRQALSIPEGNLSLPLPGYFEDGYPRHDAATRAREVLPEAAPAPGYRLGRPWRPRSGTAPPPAPTRPGGPPSTS